MNCIKDTVQRLPVYSVPQDQTVIKLNQNESPFDVPVELKSRILERLHVQAWNRYPAARNVSLLEALAAYTGHVVDGIVLGNGSNELIQAVFSAACNAGDRAVMVTPGFAVYPRVAAVLGVQAVEVPLLPSFDFDVPALITAVKDAKLVIIASPNVPTGISITPEALERIAASTRALFVVDEAYFEFSGSTAIQSLTRHDSMVIIRTLSKACSLAGARFGYALTSPSLAQGIEKAKLPFSVGIFQQVAGETLVRDRTFIRNTAEKVIAERDVLFDELKTIPDITPIPSQANFILMRIAHQNAYQLFTALYEQGILVRYFDTPALRSTLRVTVGTSDENQRFVKILRSIMVQKRRR
ncbi:histidinol-phosphate transaminase [candidate division WOR-3 bacterium]|nr:histidinol-phosphate transaminase [candidate division WOR-3 bacterium]